MASLRNSKEVSPRKDTFAEAWFILVERIQRNYVPLKDLSDEELAKPIRITRHRLVRGVGFEPTQAYASGS